MPKNKIDEQYLNEYMPKIKAFTDDRLNEENAKQIYNFLKPYNYDTDGLLLYQAAKGILQTDVYDEIYHDDDNAHHYEDTANYLDTLDGYGLLKYLETMKTADGTLGENSPLYQQYHSKLHLNAIKSIIIGLANKQPYLLEGFWNRLSYIENIFGKGFPSKEDLFERIKIEAKDVFNSASEDDLSNSNSEAEIKYKIRDELCDISLTDEMIQALMIKDNILEDIYCFYNEESQDNQIFLTVFDYLEKEENKYLADRMYERVKLEYQDYTDEVKSWPPQKIIDDAGKLNALYGICESFDPPMHEISTEHLKALYSIPSPLFSLYKEWDRRDWTFMDDIKDVIYTVASEKADENAANDYEIESENDHEDEQEL